MKFDFDQVVDRRGTNCLKYDFAVERGRKEGLLPFWVADMDFKVAPGIIERLQKALDHGVFGYSEGKSDYFAAVSSWYRERFGWETKEEWMIKTPGVVFALAMAVQAYTREGDSVLIQQPGYYPFSESITSNRRVPVNSPLKEIEGHYEIDFEDFEQKIIENKVKLFLMCSPHNPVGRVWTETELKRVGEICVRHGVIVVSDEIHSDFVYPGHVHKVFASLSKKFEDISVICTAPTKTFNLAGLQISNIFIPNPVLRKKFKRAVVGAGYSQVNLMGILACQAAYETGGEWLSELKDYLVGNLSFVREYLKEKLPEIRLVEPEGTFLVWLDFKSLGLTEEERQDLVLNKAKLWLDTGPMFGPGGEGFERINIACPRSTLAKGLDQLCAAVRGLTQN